MRFTLEEKEASHHHKLDKLRGELTLAENEFRQKLEELRFNDVASRFKYEIIWLDRTKAIRVIFHKIQIIDLYLSEYFPLLYAERDAENNLRVAQRNYSEFMLKKSHETYVRERVET